jgi:hypothetical protein
MCTFSSLYQITDVLRIIENIGFGHTVYSKLDSCLMTEMVIPDTRVWWPPAIHSACTGSSFVSICCFMRTVRNL